MRVARLAVLGLVISGLSARAVVAADPATLVGVWEMVKGPQGTPPGSTMTFKRDGQFESKIKGTDNTFTGKFRVDGNSLMLDPPGFPATFQMVNANTLVIVGITGPAEYRRQGAGGGNRVTMPRAGQKRSSTTTFSLNGGGFTAVSKSSGGMRRPSGVDSGAGGNGAIRSGPGTSDGGTVTSAAGGWKLVTSEPYGFRVEMPRQPNGEEGESGGGFSVHVLTSQLSNVELLVMAVKGSTDVPQGEKDKVFEQLLNRAAGKLGGTPKVSSQQAIMGEVTESREIEMTLEKSSGAVSARAKLFLNGKSAYAVLAASRVKDKPLPTDLKRFFDSFALNTGGDASKTGNPGTPAPAMSWGTKVDPDGDVSIRPSGRSLTMAIPGKAHVLAPERNKMNAPRVLSPARGDFVVSVQVDGAFKPGDATTVKGLSSRQAGGLILWKDAENYLVLQHRASAGEDDKVNHQAVLEELVGGKKGVTRRQPLVDGTTYLRLERKRGRISAAYSTDGKSWTELKPVDTTWAAGAIQVGVVGINTSTVPHSITFDDFALKAH